MSRKHKVVCYKVYRMVSILIILCFSVIFTMCVMASFYFPDSYNTVDGSLFKIQHFLPISAKTVENVVASAHTEESHTYMGKIMLMNVIPVKDININVVKESKVVPCGVPFGIKIFTEGVIIVGMTDVRSDNNAYNPAKESGLQKGDVIISIDQNEVHSNDEMAQIVEASEGKVLSMHVKRNVEEFDVKLIPRKSDIDGVYKAGLWVRDSSAGIGTLTFYEPERRAFAGLGHGIYDVDTHDLMPLSHGEIVSATIDGVKISHRGIPGELHGYFDNCTALGYLVKNTQNGVYGKMNKTIAYSKEMSIAMKQQIKPGEAQMLTTISGNTPKCYTVNIVSVSYNEDNPTKNMVIEITDKELLDQTGGIVQGMSGSPLIKDNLLIGAVTHVFVNNPKKGYAIFAENMLTECADLPENIDEDAA